MSSVELYSEQNVNKNKCYLIYDKWHLCDQFLLFSYFRIIISIYSYLFKNGALRFNLLLKKVIQNIYKL